MEKKAQQVKIITAFSGHAVLYRLSESMQDCTGQVSYDYVIVSSIPYSECGPAQTSILGCDCEGNVASLSELDGSYSGGTSHSAALAMAGYDVGVLA